MVLSVHCACGKSSLKRGCWGEAELPAGAEPGVHGRHSVSTVERDYSVTNLVLASLLHTHRVLN